MGVTGGFLYHTNYRFPDEYWWAMAGLTHSLPLRKDVTLSTAALAEKRVWSNRLFCDLTGTLEYWFVPGCHMQLSFHRYENLGEFDPKPTQNEEYEIGFNHDLGHKQSVGVSLFRHIQLHAPNDQFSLMKLKWSIGF